MTCTSTGRHDTLVAYKDDRCRCPAAKAAHSRRLKTWRNNKILGRPTLVDAEPTRRRLHALARMGWPGVEVLARAGAGGARRWVASARVSRTLHDAVARVYDELCMTPGPSQRTRTLAAGRGWAAPLDWDDIDDLTERPESHRVWATKVKQAAYDRKRRPAGRVAA